MATRRMEFKGTVMAQGLIDDRADLQGTLEMLAGLTVKLNVKFDDRLGETRTIKAETKWLLLKAGTNTTINGTLYRGETLVGYVALSANLAQLAESVLSMRS